jgi:membrane associated rhomboid family serine protease
MKLIPSLIAVNIFVFLMWNFSFLFHIDLYFMADNFLVSWSALEQGRYWTLLTSVFSHNMLWHLFINMFVLNSFGPIIKNVLGTKIFLFFYLSAGLISSLTHALVSAFFIHEPEMQALGASGAISGLVLLFSLIFPKQKIYIFGLIPISAIWGAIVFIGLDLWGLIAQAGGGGLPIGHGAHLGGALTGIIYYFFYRNAKRGTIPRQTFS